MEISIIPGLINKNKIKILDENFVPFPICEKSSFKSLNEFQRPFIIVDVFEASKYKDIEIKRIEISELEKYNLRFISLDFTRSTKNISKNYSGQRVAYTIRSKLEPIGNGIEIIRLPKDHYLEMDITNKRFRIRGKNAYPYIREQNASRWFEVKI